MKFKQLTNYLLAHRMQAVLLTFVFTFIPVVGVLGILFAGLVTLRKGILEGAIVTLAATAPYVVSFVLARHDPETVKIAIWMAVSVAVLSNIFTWVFAVMLYRQMSWAKVLQVAALVGVLAVSVIHLVYPDIATWWAGQLHDYYTQAAKAVSAALQEGSAGPTDDQLASIDITKYYMNGLIAGVILLNALLQVVVARWWQSIMFAPGTLRKELHNIRLSRLAGVLFVACLVVSYLGNNIVIMDIMPIVYILFTAAGLSLVHYMFGLMASPTKIFWIAVLYVTLIFAMPTSMVFVAMMALFDIWLDFRSRLKSINN